MKKIMFAVTFLAMAMGSAGAALAQQNVSSGGAWTSSYGFPSPAERNTRLSHTVEQQKLRNDYYRPPEITYNDHSTTYNTTDHSVGEMSVSAGDGTNVEISNRTAEGSGVNSYVVGSINTSNNEIQSSGSGNSIDISNSSESHGCQDGGISTSSNQTVGGMDISGTSSGSAAAAAMAGALGC